MTTPEPPASRRAMTMGEIRTALGRNTEPKPDTLPEWLYWRFGGRGDGHAPAWDELTSDDRTYWEHEAAAVRRAVARGGFKSSTSGGAR